MITTAFPRRPLTVPPRSTPLLTAAAPTARPRDPRSSGITTVHMLCGAAGDLTGFTQAGCQALYGANHLPQAILTVRANYKGLRTEIEDVSRLLMGSLPAADILVGSPICTEASPAGGKSRASSASWAATRITAYSLLQYAEVHSPLIICGENVPDFATSWALFESWVQMFTPMGYEFHLIPFNAAHVAAPGRTPVAQNRTRIMFVFAKKGIKLDLELRPPCWCADHGVVDGLQVWRNPRGETYAGFRVGRYGVSYYYACPRCHRPAEPVTTPTASVIDETQPMRYIRQGRPGKTYIPYADGMRSRIAAGLNDLQGEPFILIYRNHCTYTRLSEPTNTLTAGGNHHFLIVPGPDLSVDGCQMRRLTLREKAALQGFPDGYRFVTDGPKPRGFKGEIGNLLVGNAWPVTNAHWLAERLTLALAA